MQQMKTAKEWADYLASGLARELRHFPDRFFDSFEYTTTGQNLSHPIAWGTLAKLLWQAPGVHGVGIDVRINLGSGIKLQPDLVAYNAGYEELALIDYESPNSSDARVPWKDVDPYCKWSTQTKQSAPYVIITTLPDCASDWELRYAYGNGYNRDFHGRHSEICKNPFQFWYRYYREELKSRCLDSVALVNIDRKNVNRVIPA